MKRSHRNHEKGEVRVELKYCEHCGGLWIREGGSGVYCGQCQPKVADFPVPKTKDRKPVLPVRTKTKVEDFGHDVPVDRIPDLEAAGGVA
jgi:Zn-finger nucleic acid-binding protein